uniref:Uncharacterized protein n=1 Tax=virus sp. ctyMK1 TaxID=2828002 RepID=A0A8S5RFC6_9VIRU|nr:MAG TPA: hypothetical protein [virus sp. ctyMK1]
MILVEVRVSVYLKPVLIVYKLHVSNIWTKEKSLIIRHLIKKI